MAHVNKRRTQSGELRYDVRYRGPDDKERSRSFRTRHHQQHIDGDYKNPPQAPYRTLHRRSRELLKRPPVRLSPQLRRVVRDHFLASLQRREIQVVVLSLDDHHLHILARFAAWRCWVLHPCSPPPPFQLPRTSPSCSSSS